MRKPPSETKVLIIGAGVIGLCSAYYLSRSGYNVTVVDSSADSDTSGCSHNNAGFICPSHFIPLAAPGVMSQGLKWMLKSDSPFYVKPRLDLDLLRWTLLFNRAATESKVNEAAPLLKELSLKSKSCFRELDNELNFGLKPTGLRMMYQTEHCRREEMEIADKASKLGIEAVEFTADEVQQQEPDLKTNVLGAITYPGDDSVSPGLFMKSLKDSLKESGVQLLDGVEVKALNLNGGRINSLQTDQGLMEADEFVLCAGSWSPQLVSTIGLRLPIQAGKGYNLTVKNTDQQVAVPSILCEAKVAVSPLGNHTRFGGTMELAGLNRTISRSRLDAIKKAVNQYFPNFDVQKFNKVEPWAGLRPCSPDGLPYIGRTKMAENLVVASGHAMLGLSLGPATGELVRDVISNPDLKMEKQLSPDRYA